MGRVIVQQWISADGLVAGPNGEADLFAAVDPSDNEASEAHNRRLLQSVEEMLMGRRTYAYFREFWPTADEQPMAVHVNALSKTVCSSGLTEAPWGEHAPARIVADGVRHARERRAGGAGDTIVWGSITLMGSLLDGAAVDELELLIAQWRSGPEPRCSQSMRAPSDFVS